MDAIPLIPKSKKEGNLDVSHIIRDLFQNALQTQKFPKNVAENLNEFKVDNKALKNSGQRIVKAYNHAKLGLQDMGLVEDSLMVRQAVFLNEQDIINKNVVLTEKCKLNRKPVFINLNKNEVVKYKLLQKNDLLPTRPEVSMDFRINSNENCCCIGDDDDEFYKRAKPNYCKKGREVKLQTNAKPTERLQQLELQKDKVPARVFKPEPETIIFANYLTNVTYEKTFKLRNISKTMQSFLPGLRSRNSFFKIELHPECKLRVAPGMCAILIVRFTADSYLDHEEFAYYTSQSGHKAKVKLICKRDPPELSMYVHKNFQHFTSKCRAFKYDQLNVNRILAVNSTIDCGGCLIGKQCNINILLRNSGSMGRFFIIHENDWHNCEIKNLDENMVVTSSNFTIYPAYFEIARYNLAEMNIIFTPTNFGVEVEKFFLLCDNNSTEQFELIADGITFDSSTVAIVINDQSSVQLVSEESIAKHTRCILNFGKCVTFEKRIRCVDIQNNSSLDFPYKWELSENTHKADLKQLDLNLVTVKSGLNHLPSLSTTTFEVCINLNYNESDKKFGDYGLICGLYILDVPEASLVDNVTYYTTTEIDNDDDQEELLAEGSKLMMEKAEEGLDEEIKSKVIDVLVGEIEILCTIEPIVLQIYPPSLLLKYMFRQGMLFQKKLKIVCNTFLNCKWDKPYNRCICISPMEFVLTPNTPFYCNLTISFCTALTICETITLNALEDQSLTKSVDIDINILRPKAIFQEKILNFGNIHVRDTELKKDVVILNVGNSSVQFGLLEFAFDFKQKKLISLRKSKNISCRRGEIKCCEGCRITYTIKKKKLRKPLRWISMLVLVTQHPRVALDMCIVMFEVAKPEITIHTNASMFPILFHQKMLYVGIPETYTMCVYNTGKVTTYFKVLNPTGQDVNKLNVSFTPKVGFVKPTYCEHVFVTITPLEPGVMTNAFLPCCIGSILQPQLVNIVCVVDNILVIFYLPEKCKMYQKVYWPPPLTYEFDTNIELSSFEQEEDTVSYLRTVHNSLTSLISIPHHNTLVDIINYTKEGMTNCCEEELKYEYCVDSSNASFEKSRSMSEMASCASLLSDFGSELILQNYVLRFINISLRTPVKKTVIIKNITPLKAQFTTEAVNFQSIPEDEEQKIIKNTLCELNINKPNVWEESMRRNKGVVVKITPSEGQILINSTISLDVWVYGNTWGTYLEEVVIEISDIPPFCFNLLIEVVGNPIEFPIALNTISKDIVVRFGIIPYLSNPIQRKLKVTNSSAIPLSLVWHIFSAPRKSKCKNSPRKDPFNLTIDLYEQPDTPESEQIATIETNIQCEITRNFYGTEDFNVLYIHPRDIRIKSHSTVILDITLDPKLFKTKFQVTPIKAILRGKIHIASKYSFQQNVFYRHVEHQIPKPVQLLATLEMPLLKLDLLRGDTRINTYANDVYKASQMRFERLLVFQNPDKSPAAVYMHIGSPFKIVSLRTSKTHTTSKHPLAAQVLPGECVEVVVECTIDREEVLHYSDMLFNSKTTLDTEEKNIQNRSVTLARAINIHQKGLEEQITTMELILYYPELRISHEVVDFGMVFVGNTKKMLLTLTNPTGSYIPFKITKTCNYITAVPVEGYVPKANGTTPSNIIISLYFIPEECKVFQEAIRIITNIPFYTFLVNIMGTGTNNEKFYIEGV